MKFFQIFSDFSEVVGQWEKQRQRGGARFEPQNLPLIKNEALVGGGYTWVAPSVKCPTLDFSSGHDLTVGEIEPHVGLFAHSMEPAWDSVSLPLTLCPSCALSLSLSLSKINKLIK